MLQRPQWFRDVDTIYTTVLIKKYQWVGLIIDLTMMAIYVVDFNQACPSEFDVVGVLTPISVMLPFMLRKFCSVPSNREITLQPLPISRIEVPILLEQPGTIYILLGKEYHVIFDD